MDGREIHGQDRPAMTPKLAIGSLVLVALSAPVVARAAGPKTAVVDAFVLPGRLDYARADLLRAASEILEKRNWQPIVPAGAACRDRGCLPQVASETQAEYLLVVRGRYVTTGKYADLGVDLWREGVVIRSAGEESQISDRAVSDTSSCSSDLGCTITDVIARIRQFAAKVVDEENAARDARSKIAIAPPPTTVPNVATPPIAATPEAPGVRRKVVGIVLLAGAVAALATGGVLWYLDGRDVGCTSLPDGQICDRSRDSRTAAIATLSGGVALGLVGGILLYKGRSGATAQLDVGAKAVALGGTF